ncbi:MAG: glycosyl transferase family 8 [Candidatus Nanoarchaeia archaeon]|nr:glycosyl transferase family 8 [Candidatus Nanoarchaeia archaeon]MDD5588044.1 glycosyl transferase family 8 [Candidatus Nanoarchaeia archaeon]
MKNVIITCSDKNCEDFLVNDWLKSLIENVNLSNIDIIIIDYGISKNKLNILKKNKNVKIYKAIRCGFPNAIKFKDIEKILKKNIYYQVMTCDCADLIFQEDINSLFEKNNEDFRAVVEDMTLPFEKFMSNVCFDKEKSKEIKEISKRKQMINMGVLIAPYEKFSSLCKECNSLLKKKVYLADQIAVSYFLYKNNFKRLDCKYNFIPMTTNEKFYINNGEFYLNSGEKIAIVHNVGGNSKFRIIKNFGYGKNKNEYNKIKYFILNKFIKICNKIR